MRTLSALPLVLLIACDGGGETPEDPCEVSGNVCSWLGIPGVSVVTEEGADRTRTGVFMSMDIAFAPDGTAFYPDFNAHRVRRVDLDGTVTTISGTGMLGDGPNQQGSASNCWEGCDASASAWNHPTSVTVDPTNPDLVWVAAWHNSRINLLDLGASTMTWFAGTGGRFFGESDVDADGSVLDDAVLDLPSSIAFDDLGNLYFSDQANHVVRRITPEGAIEVVAGAPRSPGFAGDGGPATEALLHGHTDQKADPGSKLTISGRDLYLADTVNGVIRRIDLDTGTIDRVAGRYESKGTATYTDAITGVQYEADDGSVPGYDGDGGDALDAALNTPRDVAVGPDGELYLADTKNACVRVVRDGVIDTFAGTCGEVGFAGDEGPAADAVFGEVFGVDVDPEGNVYVSDTSNQVIRRVAR